MTKFSEHSAEQGNVSFPEASELPGMHRPVNIQEDKASPVYKALDVRGIKLTRRKRAFAVADA